MNRTEIFIERLVLDGLELGPGDVRTLRTSLESELAGAFARDDGGRRSAEGFRPDASANPAEARRGTPAGLGREAAIAIHNSVVGTRR